jgi:hypothetical protein
MPATSSTSTWPDYAERHIEVRRREADGSLTRHEARDGGMVTLQSVGCELAVDEVYRDELAAD